MKSIKSEIIYSVWRKENMRPNRVGYGSVGFHGSSRPVDYTIKVAGESIAISPQAGRLLRGVVSRQNEIRFQCGDKSGSVVIFTAKFPANEAVGFHLPVACCARIRPGQKVLFQISLKGQNEFGLSSELVDTISEPSPHLSQSPLAQVAREEIKQRNCDPQGRRFPTKEDAKQALIEMIAMSGGRLRVELIATGTERPRKVMSHMARETFCFGFDLTGRAYEFEANIYFLPRDQVKRGRTFFVLFRDYTPPFKAGTESFEIPAGDWFNADFDGLA